MIKLDDLSVKKAAGDTIYKRGLELYNDGAVKNLIIEKVDGLVFVDAQVDSSNSYDEYEVELVIDPDLGVLENSCDCPAGNDFWGEYICKHRVAVLLKYIYQMEEKLQNNNSIETSGKGANIINDFINAFAEKKIKKEELNIEYKYVVERSFICNATLELKVGIDKLYVVKDLKNFLSAVCDEDKTIDFGKNFIYNPRKHTFKNEDKPIIDMLLDIYETTWQLSQQHDYYGRNNSARILGGKKAYLTDSRIKTFFNAIGSREFNFSFYGKDYNGISVTNEDIPLKFNLCEQNNEILLKADNMKPTFLTRDGEFIFFEDKIYKPSEEQRKYYVPIYDGFINTRKNEIAFDKSLINHVASFVIPSLKKISQKVDIDKAFVKNFYEVSLTPKLYFDKQDDNIISHVDFNYRDITINPLSDQSTINDERILIRDAETEMKIISIYENYNFIKGNGAYILQNEENIIKFISEGVSELQEVADVYYSDAFNNIKIFSSSKVKAGIKLNDQDLLEFNFDIDGIEKSELKDVFKAIREKKRYHRLKDGAFISLDSEELNNVADLIDYLEIKDSELLQEKIMLSKYNSFYLDASINDNNMFFIERSKRFRELINNFKEIRESEYELPKHLETVLRNYQKTGFKWFKTLQSCGFGGILADEMGLGKTVQAIAFIESELKEQGEIKKPVLVVAPTSLVYNWKSEIDKFSPQLKAIVISGNKQEREALRNEIDGSDIIITTYPLIRRDIDEYKEIEFSLCILDEAQQIKNPLSQSAQAVKEIKSNGRFALTGTPIENSLTELWSIFDFIMPGYLLSHGRFVSRYESPIIKAKNKEALAELNRHIKPFILRRFKSEVVKELPPKIEHKVVVEMTDEQKKLYAAYVQSAKEEIARDIKEFGINQSRIKIFALLTRLRQICCDPSCFIENYNGDSGKLLALDELIEESIQSGHRILLFSQFTTVLKNIEKRLKKNFVRYMHLDGQTMTEKRMDMVNRFNAGEGSVFLISLKAGGTGLNLTGADVVIHFDPWWNPAVEQQAVDRAHRIGQKKTVQVIKLITKGTIEEKIYALQEKKKEIIHNVLDEDNSTDIVLSRLNEEELKELFS